MSSNNNVGNVSIRIMNKLNSLPPRPPQKSIFKVHRQLRSVNEKAYEPQYVAIGPYHHNNENCRHHMEEQKQHYLQQLLRRRGEAGVDEYVEALRKIQVMARQQYDGIVNLTQEEFLEMMLLDGCFIIEYFRKVAMKALGDENDLLLSAEWIRNIIRHDLQLLENQLPFIVLETLYDMTKDDTPLGKFKLVDIACNYFFGAPGRFPQEMNGCKHLLDLVYQGLILRVSREAPVGDFTSREGSGLPFIRTATELKEFGIKFKPGEGLDIFDIKFNRGTLDIPPCSIGDNKESLFRNLIAYEHYCPGREIKYVTDYVNFLDRLVNTPKDVELLRQKGIIVNYLGDDEAVSKMLNKMGDYIPLTESYYAGIFTEVIKHCEKRQNRWMAILKRDYFHSPWALISILAAIVLLLLTLIQTVYSGLSYRKD